MTTSPARFRAVPPALAILIAALLVAFAGDAGAFGGHDNITRAGFADPTGPGMFLRSGVVKDINAQHGEMDSVFFPFNSSDD